MWSQLLVFLLPCGLWLLRGFSLCSLLSFVVSDKVEAKTTMVKTDGDNEQHGGRKVMRGERLIARLASWFVSCVVLSMAFLVIGFAFLLGGFASTSLLLDDNERGDQRKEDDNTREKTKRREDVFIATAQESKTSKYTYTNSLPFHLHTYSSLSSLPQIAANVSLQPYGKRQRTEKFPATRRRNDILH